MDERSGGLTIEAVSHAFDGLTVVDSVSLEVGAGELVCLLGPSGCGKTTLLRVAAGLEPLQRGCIRIAGRIVADPGTWIPPEGRGVGMVFQDYALFPHLTVAENVEFGLSGQKTAERRATALDYLRRLGMADHAGTYPHTLSGGEQQRVALARALAPRPAVMLMDEPFSGLDIRLRDAVRDESLALLREEGSATLLVTHDPEEAMRMADRIAVMRGGRIIQQGTPAQIYGQPADPFIAEFFGDINKLPGIVDEQGEVKTQLGSITAEGFPSGAPVDVLIRPEAVRLNGSAEGATATVQCARPMGPFGLVDVRLATNDCVLTSRVAGFDLPQCGDAVGITLNPALTFVFPRSAS